MTTPTVEEIVDEFGCCYASSKCDIYFDKGIDHNIVLAKEITTYGQSRYEEGVKAERERVMEWASVNEFDVEKAVNDPTADFIAHDAYESKAEAFYEGYNQALKELIKHYTTE